jgi:LuxR family maltose regulon positive regulatory protein
MESANIFIDALDENHNWYRYHSLFAGVLRRRLPAREAVELHERASEWMAAHGRQEYAIRHAREAGNFARGADLAQDLAEKALNRCEAATVLSWTDSLSPAERRARPLVCVFRAFAMLDLGMPLAGVRQLLRDATIGDVAKGFQAEIDAARCYLAFLADKPAESLSLAHRALSRETSKRTLARSVAETILGILSDSTGDINVARRVYMHSLQNARRAGNDYISIVVIWRLARIAVMSGALSRAARLCADAVELAEARRQRPLPVAAFPLLLQAEVHVERGNLVEAEQAIAQARPLAAQWTVDAMLEYARVTSVIYRASGNLRAALRAARRGVDLGLRKDVRESELRPIEANVAELSIAVGDIEEAETWAEDRRLSLRARSSKGKSHARDSNAFEAETLALARLLLARSRPEEALSATRLLLANSRRRGTIRTTIKALVIKTLALDAMGHTEKALGITSELLAMGEPEGFIQSLVDGGHVMHRLLREASSKGVRKLYAERILAAFPVSGRSRRPPPHESCALLLSSREVEIMLLLSKGFSNKEIAERAFLALQTVKWHTSNIYSKLGVKNRIQAVARARARGIIPRY